MIDFGNGTYQGAAHGLARLLAAGMLPPEFSGQAILQRIDALFIGAGRLRRADGSMEEAFPFEASYCVTALAAYDLLSAVELLQEGFWDRSKVQGGLEVVKPMIEFLCQSDEVHAFISNHLATASAALFKWTRLTGEDGRKKGEDLLQRILLEQSEEGWYREYQGADPGYQSLCTYYLADIYRMEPTSELRDSLERSLEFLWHFAHPDGSFGGLYGSRNTRFYYPAGIEYLSGSFLEAASLASFMRQSVQKNSVVTLAAMDESNLVPMFNSYCWAATTLSDDRPSIAVPALERGKWRKVYEKAGLLVDKGPEHYTIISWHKGGLCSHFSTTGTVVNAGAIVSDAKNQLFSTQGYDGSNSLILDGDNVMVESHFTRMNREHPTPFQFAVLRFLCLTVMRLGWLRDLIKKMLVTRLITGVHKAGFVNRRKIELGPDLRIDDHPELPGGWRLKKKHQQFFAIHMASQGYWQIQDEGCHDPKV
ncbi:hypothetical protein [Syntrophotalea acetylenivorans]|uniref:hypothetical protein n=1 Tax=Syntrophotalea acetylenivorans TaxID=1842532 RepID=UPI0011AB529F|nr:hypothetical protein [Syntrophotalea acetylenivorans]